MQKKKTVILLAVILALSVIGCAVAVITAGDPGVVPEFTKRAGAAKTITVPVASGDPVTLEYVNTYHVTFDHFFDIYKDADNTRVRIDENGRFVGYTKDIKAPDSMASPVSRAEALRIANAEIKRLLPDKAAEFSPARLSGKQDDDYYFTYEKNYGKDGFLTGESVDIWVRKDGVVTFCSFPNLYDFEDLDPKKLDGADRKAMDDLFTETADNVYENSDPHTAQAERYSLKKTKNGYVVEIFGSVDCGEQETGAAVRCYYALG